MALRFFEVTAVDRAGQTVKAHSFGDFNEAQFEADKMLERNVGVAVAVEEVERQETGVELRSIEYVRGSQRALFNAGYGDLRSS